MRMNQLLTWRAGVLLSILVTAASLRAGQQPPSSAPKIPGQGPSRQFPGIPNGPAFPVAPNTRQFFTVPEVKEFPPFKALNFKPPTVVVDARRPDAAHVVCGMLVVPGSADLDRKILRPVSPDAPKGAIQTVEGTCESAAISVEPTPKVR